MRVFFTRFWVFDQAKLRTNLIPARVIAAANVPVTAAEAVDREFVYIELGKSSPSSTSASPPPPPFFFFFLLLRNQPTHPPSNHFGRLSGEQQQQRQQQQQKQQQQQHSGQPSPPYGGSRRRWCPDCVCYCVCFGEIWFKESMILFAFILLKVSIFERRAGSGAAGDRKINDF